MHCDSVDGHCLSVCRDGVPVSRTARPYIHAELAAILQCKRGLVHSVAVALQQRGLLAQTPARQFAQVAIASRCGNSVAHGISLVEALSAPVAPMKLHGSDRLFDKQALRVPNLSHLESYSGFMTPLPALAHLPEEHSFVDMLEKILLAARQSRAHPSMLEGQGVELGTVVMSAQCVQVTFDYGNSSREIVQYPFSGALVTGYRDFAQFAKHTVLRLAALADSSLAEVAAPECKRLAAAAPQTRADANEISEL